MLKTRVYRIALLGGILATLVGCGSYPEAPLASGQNPTSLNLQQGGALILSAAKSYQTLASSADVRYVLVLIAGTGSFSQSQTLSWPLKHDMVFSGLTADTYSVTLKALDKNFAVLGSVKEQNVAVREGQITSLPLRLSLGSVAADESGLSLSITIDDGGTVTSPSPSPSPVPTPIPAPVTIAFADDFETRAMNWQSSWTKSSYGTALSASTGWTNSTVAAHDGSFGACPGGSDKMVTETGTYAMSMLNSCDLSGYGASALRFDLAGFASQIYFQAAKLQVDASKDGGTTWAQVYDQVGAQENWKRIEVDMSAYRSANVKIRFRFVYDYYLGTQKMVAPSIDNVSLGTK